MFTNLPWAKACDVTTCKHTPSCQDPLPDKRIGVRASASNNLGLLFLLLLHDTIFTPWRNGMAALAQLLGVLFLCAMYCFLVLWAYLRRRSSWLLVIRCVLARRSKAVQDEGTFLIKVN